MSRIKTDDKTIRSFFCDTSMIFDIPVNQRKYSWNLEQVHQYWEDLSKVVGKEGKKHYLGVITLIEKESVNDLIKRYEVIDGQQRLITTILFISALRDFYIAIDEKDLAKELHKEFLVSNTTKESYNKLTSCKIDSYTFNNIVNINLGRGKVVKLKEDSNIRLSVNSCRMILETDEEYINKNIYTTYKYFYNQILSHYNLNEDKEYLSNLEDSLGKLDIITVTSDSIANMFLYFDSLNNRGLHLSQMDIIRNIYFKIISQKYSEEINVFSDLWDDLVLTLDDLDGVKFLKYYSICSQLKVYTAKELPSIFENNFKNIGEKEELKLETRKMIDYSKIYNNLFSKYNNSSEHIYSENIDDINQLGQQACHSFLMDYFYNVDSPERRKKIVYNIENMMYRRIVCNSSNKKLDGIFKSIISLREEGDDRKFNYNDSIIIDKIKEYTPKNDEFKECFINKDWEKGNLTIYTLKKYEKYINQKRKNATNELRRKDIYLEYILPEIYKKEIAEVYSISKDEYQKLIYKIGNIMLLDVPIDANDKINCSNNQINFQIYKEYNINQVVEILEKYDDWGKGQIIERNEHIANLALKIWDIS